MESFVGMRVRLDLLDGAVMEGLIGSLDEGKQLLTLSEVICQQPDGQQIRFPGLLEVFGSDICNIELLPSTTVAVSPSEINRPVSTTSIKKKGATAWASDDVRAIKAAQDFDFQASLGLFDKSRVFGEIRAQDKTAEGQRLVAHNLSARGQMAKIKHTESVLEHHGEDEEVQERILSIARSQIRPPPALNRAPLLSRPKNIPRPASAPRVLLRSPSGQILDPQQSSSSLPSYPNIRIEACARALVSHLGNILSDLRMVECLLGDDSFLSAVCYCLARHLMASGVPCRITSYRRSNDTSGPYYQCLEEHRDFYQSLIQPLLDPSLTLALPAESIVVNAAMHEIATPPAAATVLLNMLPSRQHHSTAIPTSSVFFDVNLLAQPAAVSCLASMHPRSAELFLANDGPLLADSQIRPLFEGSHGEYTETVRLVPFTQ